MVESWSDKNKYWVYSFLNIWNYFNCWNFQSWLSKIFRKLLLIFHGNRFLYVQMTCDQAHWWRIGALSLTLSPRQNIRPFDWLTESTIHSICSKWNGSRTLEAPFSWRIRASGVFGFVFDETTNRIYCHRVSKHHLSLVTWKYAQSTYLDVPKPIEG